MIFTWVTKKCTRGSTCCRPAPATSFLLFPAHQVPLFYRTTRANPPSIPHSHGLHPSSPFYSPPSLSLRCYLASRIAYVIMPPRSLPSAALPILSHLPPYPPAYQSFDVLPSSSCTVFPVHCDAIERGHFVHGYSFRPAFVASVSISSLGLHICLHPLSCRFPRLLRAVLLDWIRCC
ncbi:hypothetical protein B0H13DRAFT_1946294 [Mycena leptocephala]|nr:hypothetical protein B0H13DRAFT_1946294 [Mycena leptocephala]